jgi:hypothetical protein
MLLMIRCVNDEVSAFFHIPDGIDCQNHSATVRFGMGKATPEDFDVGGRRPDRGDLCLAVGFWGNEDTVPFLKSVGTGNKLAVRISSNRDFTGVFDLAGSKSAVAEVFQACGIPWDGSAFTAISPNFRYNVPRTRKAAAAGPDSPGAETTINTYARISADIPACKLRPLSWGKELRAKIRAAIPASRKDLASEFERTAKTALDDPDPNACDAPEVHDLIRYGDGVIAGTRSVWDIFD